jgi:hypothetical protein
MHLPVADCRPFAPPFLPALQLFFPQIFDIKYLMKVCEGAASVCVAVGVHGVQVGAGVDVFACMGESCARLPSPRWLRQALTRAGSPATTCMAG